MATQDPHSWQDGLQVVSVPDEQILSQHSFATSAESLSQTATGRTKHLRNEIQWLENGIPRNIFVRYGESRMDVMKIVIAGPVGSPYEHGLFEFDLLCPAEYPRNPPKMFFRTTGGGSVYFNPNLYHNGYVCLSLINTWNGDQWQAGTSTLLQVFVSIQAMVFCEEPWCNEPGREGLQGTEASLQFNHSLYKNVIKYGMLEWIECKKTPPPPPKSSRWSDMPPGIPGAWPATTRSNSSAEAGASSKTDVFSAIAKTYFDANRESIITTVKRWIREVDEAKELAEKKRQDHFNKPPPPPPFPAFPAAFDATSYAPPPHPSLHEWGYTFETKPTTPSSVKSAPLSGEAALEYFLSEQSKMASLPPGGSESGAANANPPPPFSFKHKAAKNNAIWSSSTPNGPPPQPSSFKNKAGKPNVIHSPPAPNTPPPPLSSFKNKANKHDVIWSPPTPNPPPPPPPSFKKAAGKGHKILKAQASGPAGQPPPPAGQAYVGYILPPTPLTNEQSPSPPDAYAPVDIDDAVEDWLSNVEKKKKEKLQEKLQAQVSTKWWGQPVKYQPKEASPDEDDDSEWYMPAKVADWCPDSPPLAHEPPPKPPPPKARYFTRSVASRMPQPKKIELVPENATLLQYLKAALTDLGGMENPRRRIEV